MPGAVFASHLKYMASGLPQSPIDGSKIIMLFVFCSAHAILTPLGIFLISPAEKEFRMLSAKVSTSVMQPSAHAFRYIVQAEIPMRAAVKCFFPVLIESIILKHNPIVSKKTAKSGGFNFP